MSEVRVNMDDSLLSDPRVRRLLSLTGCSQKELLGTLFLVWLPCYQRKTPNLPPDEIDMAADHDGFAKALIESKLATVNEDGTLRLRGVEERIRFLLAQAEKGRRRHSHGSAGAEPPVQPRLDLGSAPGQPSSLDLDLTLTPDLDHALDHDQEPQARKPGGKPKGKRPIPADWKPNEKHAAIATELKLSLTAQADHFRDWAMGKGQQFVDWDAAFRNWLRNSNRFSGGRPANGTGYATGFDHVMGAIGDRRRARGEG